MRLDPPRTGPERVKSAGQQKKLVTNEPLPKDGTENALTRALKTALV